MRARIGLILSVLGSVLAAGTAQARTARSQSSAEGVPAFGHVFLIIGENTTYSHLNMTNAPYLMGTIRPAAAWLTDYYAATRWSEAN